MLLLGITQGNTWGWGDLRTAGLIVLGLGLLIAWVVSESRSTSPLVDTRVMRIRGVWTVNLLALALDFACSRPS